MNSKLLLTRQAVFDLADILEDRREKTEAGIGIGDLDDDPTFHAWQRWHGDVAADLNINPQIARSNLEEVIKVVQALLEAARVHYQIDRHELLDRAREDGPPSELPFITHRSRQ